jgi:hypothetical protein
MNLRRTGEILMKTNLILVATLLAVSLARTDASAQQPGASVDSLLASCFTSGVVLDGKRRPPTPALVEERENCLARDGQALAAREQSITTSPETRRELDKIYDELARMSRDETNSAVARQ